MDKDNMTPQTPSQPQIAQPSVTAVAQPEPATPQVSIQNPDKGSNKVILWFVLGLIIIVLLVGGIYFFLSKQQPIGTGQPATIQAPSPSPQANLDSDLNSINVDAATASADFTSVDQDLKQL